MSFLIRKRKDLVRLNLILWYRRKIKVKIRKHNPKTLSSNQKQEIKAYYDKRGYKNVKTYWHRYFGGFNNIFSVEYLPEDIFHPYIAATVNEMKQWPALLDKNLLEVLFPNTKQLKSVVKNINGFYYNGSTRISEKEAIDICNTHDRLVIKPSIESGGGKDVIGFRIKDKITDYKDMSLKHLLREFEKDFIVQEILEQHEDMKTLNESSLNSIRILSYLREDGVHVLSSIVRIGRAGAFTDNSSSGGMSCGINEDGSLKGYGFNQAGNQRFITDSGTHLNQVVIPAFDKAKELIKAAHINVPYFKLIAWDVAIDRNKEPVLIEYNTYRMGISSLQLANGPLLGKFTDELLELGQNKK